MTIQEVGDILKDIVSNSNDGYTPGVLELVIDFLDDHDELVDLILDQSSVDHDEFYCGSELICISDEYRKWYNEFLKKNELELHSNPTPTYYDDSYDDYYCDDYDCVLCIGDQVIITSSEYDVAGSITDIQYVDPGDDLVTVSSIYLVTDAFGETSYRTREELELACIDEE